MEKMHTNLRCKRLITITVALSPLSAAAFVKFSPDH